MDHVDVSSKCTGGMILGRTLVTLQKNPTVHIVLVSLQVVFRVGRMVTLVTLKTGSPVNSFHVVSQACRVGQILTAYFTREQFAIVFIIPVLL